MDLNKHKTSLLFLLLLVVISLGYFLIITYKTNELGKAYLFSKLLEGDFIKSINTSGVIEPKQVISVGTQVSGIVEKVNVQENTPVTKGEIIATLDKKLFINEAQKNQANLDKIKEKIALIQVRKNRLVRLIKSNFASKDSYDEMEIQLKIEEANYALAKAAMDKSAIELNYTDIIAPIDGVILEKLVEPGQTVASSFTTPILFKIAKNLQDMQITTKISEVDIPLIKVGQKVSFTVNGFPNKVFNATIQKIKINPNIQQGIVTYDVVLNAENPNGLLKPGMTASMEIILNHIKNTRYILTDALRFADKNNPTPSKEKIVYLYENNKIIPVSVVIGVQNEQYTQILNDAIKPNQKIIIGVKNNEPD